MPLPLPHTGLYAITDSRLIPDGRLLDHVARAIEGGAVLVQYREKQRPREQRAEEAGRLARLCHSRGVPLLINDDIELARSTGADGVHLGVSDRSPQTARQQLGERAIIGVSCYNRLERAHAACRAGASYVAFGRFFPSRTKPEAVQAPLDLLRRARRELEIPIVAIGGITPANGAALLAAGADLLAVIHGLFAQADIRAAGRRYSELFRGRHPGNRLSSDVSAG
jgi:thiamine-phosphate pyrophosphorylase